MRKFKFSKMHFNPSKLIIIMSFALVLFFLPQIPSFTVDFSPFSMLNTCSVELSSGEIYIKFITLIVSKTPIKKRLKRNPSNNYN